MAASAAAAAAAGAGAGARALLPKRAAAAIAAVAMTNTTTAVGGKRKGVRGRATQGNRKRHQSAAPDVEVKTVSETKAKTTEPWTSHDAWWYGVQVRQYAEHAKTRVLDGWIDTQLLDVDDDAPDDADALRRQILALPSRPVFEFYKGWDTKVTGLVRGFVETLVFPPNLTGKDYHAILSGIARPCPDSQKFQVDMDIARELSLLLRLFVALGGDLNLSLVRFYGAHIAATLDDAQFDQLKKEYPAAPLTTTLGVDLTSNPTAAIALILAGRRLRVKWETFATRWDGLIYTAVDAVLSTLAQAGIHATYGRPDFRPLQARLLHVAGEAGIFFCSHCDPKSGARLATGTQVQLVGGPFSKVFSWIGDYSCGWMAWRFGEFEHDDHSPYLYPEARGQEGWVYMVNYNRAAYRREFPARVHQAVAKLIPDLCKLVAEYAVEPLRAALPALPAD